MPEPFCATSVCWATAMRGPRRRWRWSSAKSEPVAVDRDEVLLIEDWRLRPDGTAIAPGVDPKDTAPIYTVNGQLTLDIPARGQ